MEITTSGIPQNSPLFNDLCRREYQEKQSQIKKEIREPLEDTIQISKLGRLFLELENITDPRKTALKLKQAGIELGIAEVDLRKFVANKQFLTSISDKNGYHSIFEADKLPLLAKLVSYGIRCPALTALTLTQRNSKLPIDFTSQDTNQTFRNEYVASQNRLKEFANRYSSLFC